MARRREHIVLFPLMAQGHIIPFLALGLKLEQEKGYDITFVNTRLNIKKLHSYIPHNSSIHLLEIPYNSADHGLPPNSESTETIPPALFIPFIASTLSLKPAFNQIISNLVDEQNGMPPLCLISDAFFGWSAEIAHKFGIFHAIFHANAGYGMASFHTFWSNLPHLKENSQEFPLPGFPEGYKFRSDQLPFHYRLVRGPPQFLENRFQEWLETDAMLFNTVEEFDHVGLTYFRQQFQCPIWPIGPIISNTGSKARSTKGAETTMQICIQWLDSKPPHSVLYVAFGSQGTPSVSQTKQLAMALEASGTNFLWVARPPSSFVSDGRSTYEEWLPEGFSERIHKSKQGLMVLEWAPQMEILSHNSICAFLSHCGWNSVIEALSNGVPILSWPMDAEQPFNAKMLEEEIGVCIRVACGIDCEIKYEEIVKKIELITDETKGKYIRIKSCNIKEVIDQASKNHTGLKGSSAKALDDFLDSAFQKRNLPKLSA